LVVNLVPGVVYTIYTTTFYTLVTTPYTWNVTPPVGGTVSLYQAGQVQWYTAAVGGSPIGTGATFNPVGVAGSGIADTLTPVVVHFYAACSTNTTCRTDTTFTVAAANAGAIIPDQTICSGSVADLVLVGNTGSVVRWQYADDFAFTVGVTNIAASASNTLTSAQIGTITGTRYFRAQISVGSCNLYSNVVTITYNRTIWTSGAWSNGTPDATFAADFQEDYDSAGDLEACSVVVNSGASVTFYGGDTLTVENEVNVASGTLAFENNASLVQVNDVANAPGVYSGGNTGSITYTRKSTGMRLLDYTYWSTPVNPQTLLNVSPLTTANYFFEYNSSLAIPNWQGIAPSSTMGIGRGYLIRAPANFNTNLPLLLHTANFIGVPNNGMLTTTVVGGANQWNLLGNPYPSALDIDALISANPVLGGTVYLWTHNTISTGIYIASDYAIYNYVGGVGTASGNAGVNLSVPNGKIASGQGFFIKGLSSGTVNFSNTMRIPAGANNNDQFFRRANSESTSTTTELEKHRYWLDISNSDGAFKQALVGYVETATLGIDRLFDGDMANVNSVVTLYTTAENRKLSIQGRPLPFDVEDTIPLGYKSTIASTYTINLSQFDGLFESQKVYLEDTLLNVIHDLNAAPYTFATEIGTFDNRFILRYTTSALGIHNPEFNANTVVVYKNNSGLVINSGALPMKNVTIYDITGREIASKKQVGSTQTVFSTLPTTQQVLLVKIEGENGGLVTKKIVY